MTNPEKRSKDNEPSDRALVARQPICNGSQRTVAYELLYRHSRENFATITNAEEATARVIVNSFLEIGFDRIVGSSLAFINVTRTFILSDYWRSLPRDRVILEILEDVELDPVLLEGIRQARQAQYRFALDDFVFEPHRLALLPFCSYVKVDLRQVERKTIVKELRQLKDTRVNWVAEKVQTFEEFDFCRTAGFHYFQGYFFCRPRILSVSQIPSNRVAICRLLSRLQQPDISSREVATIVEEDLSLSYRLLRYINSASVSLPHRIESIGHAVRMVGLEHIKLLASLIMLTSLEGKPRELLTVSLVRAKMCSSLAGLSNLPNKESYFTVGLFSALDAFLDCPMAESLKLLPLSDDVRDALLHGTGPMGEILKCTLAHEQGQWCELPSLAAAEVGQSYLTALEWADHLLEALSHE